jgi:protein-S-isoprenylcysteine O-methyltransferase Ste14
MLAVICLAIMFLLHWLWPLLIIHPPFNLAGFLLVGTGLAICFRAQRQFRKVGTNLYPFSDPQKLVTDGLFRYTRNPMYLGLVIFLAGVWVTLGSLLPAGIVLAFLLVADRWYIAYEEQRLISVFGEAYKAYQAKTPRWI